MSLILKDIVGSLVRPFPLDLLPRCDPASHYLETGIAYNLESHGVDSKGHCGFVASAFPLDPTDHDLSKRE